MTTVIAHQKINFGPAPVADRLSAALGRRDRLEYDLRVARWEATVAEQRLVEQCDRIETLAAQL